MAKRRAALLALSAGALLLVGAPALAASAADNPLLTPAPGDMVRYLVRPGDNLFRLASDYLIRPETYRTVQQLNRVADPLRLPVGKTLLIPRVLLKQEAVRGTVLSWRGAVRIDGRPAATGMPVTEGMLLETGQKSFVTVTLPDDTSIALPSQSAVRVRRLRKVVLDRHVERLFAIERGRASASVTPMTDPASTFQFATPGAVTSVRGTRFRMGYDADAHRATSEVLEGKVGFDPQGRAAQVLPAGFGSASDLDEPVALLPPPRLVEAGAPQTAEALRFAWQPLPGARAYRVQIAADAQFLKVLDETVATDPAAQFAALPDGHYFVRATGVDEHGLEGEPALADFERRLENSLRLSVEESWNGPVRQYVFHWDPAHDSQARFRFQLAKPGREERPMIDRPDLTSHALVGLALPAGRYRWRVLMEEMVDGKPVSHWSDYQDVRIEASW
ncbi:FecR family protein [Novosphingobium pokkalii]|uniref:FecR domain-containing protein n=1 Tax=Novosphingobium pokkalii TaxID=1770194 RepID=A0ABV7V1K1_9SPHN|nr:FecR domain-containing protein [Novosphingobium pokkalii]